MSWSDKQKQLAVRACKGANIDDAQRELILRQLGGRAIVNGRVTSTSAKLTNAEFNQFMATVEVYSGGQVKIRDRSNKYRYRFGHWQLQQQDNNRLQLIYIARRIIGSLTAEQVPERIGGVIAKATRNRIEDVDDLDDLDEAEAHNVVNALRAVAQRHNIPLMSGASA